jgi:hypothetical protein
MSRIPTLLIGLLYRPTAERSGSGSFSQRYGSVDPDQHQNVTDPVIVLFADQQLNEAVTDPEVLAEVVQQLKSYGVKNGLKPFELPARSVLLPRST